MADALKGLGQEMHNFMSELYPICRSITGNGLRETLSRISSYSPLSIREIPTGTRIFDWTIPKEWNIRDAYIRDSRGSRVIDFRNSNLHVMSYSIPFKGTLNLSDLKKHLHSLPQTPDWVPYRTAYYTETWGFCLSHKQLQKLDDGEYEVCIDSTLEDGYLTYGECYLRGETEQEILISCHVCHPSLCNDNLSGIAVASFLAKTLASSSRRYSYRFVFLPVTIGAIAWLALNEDRLAKIKHGLVLTCVGDAGKTTYKKSRRGNAEIDRAADLVLQHSGTEYSSLEFSPYGYDERQYCSPAFDLPVGCLMRTPNGCFPEYHTSADDLDFVKPSALEDSFRKAWAILNVLEHNRVFRNTNPKCEPQLGKRGLYKTPGSKENLALLWVLNLSDGTHSLLDIAERSGMSFDSILSAVDALVASDLLIEVPNT